MGMGPLPLLAVLIAGQIADPEQLRVWVSQLNGPEDSDATQYRPFAELRKAGTRAVPYLIEGIRNSSDISFLNRINQLLYEVDDERPAQPLYEARIRMRRLGPRTEPVWPSLARYASLPALVSPDLSANDTVRREIAYQLLNELSQHGFRPGPALRARALRGLYDSEAGIRASACGFAASVRAEEAAPRLVELLDDARIREAAAASLARLELPETVPALLTVLTWQGYVAWGVAVDLRRFAKPEHLAAILRLAREHPGLPRAYAINLVGYLRDASAIPDLQRYREDPLERVRLATDNAIRRIQGILP